MRVDMISCLVTGLAIAATGAHALPKPSPLPVYKHKHVFPPRNIELGPRPEFLVHSMDAGALKDKLTSCLEKKGDVTTTQFSIGHRGGAVLQFPEETLESHMAGIRMGAGILECDVAFTKDLQFVCRHDQCDLHTTTNIVDTPLGAKCTTPFQPADPGKGKLARAKCCTSDITLAEYKTLCGKMDGYNASALTPADYLHGTPAWRTDLYATCGTVLSHAEYMSFIASQGLLFTAELKQPRVSMPFQGTYTLDMYRQQLVDAYVRAGIPPEKVWLQSFVFEDVAYWLKHAPEFGRQAILLDQSGDAPGSSIDDAAANLTFYKEAGVRIVGPPLQYLVSLDGEGDEYVPSTYAKTAKKLGLDVITWSLERSGPLAQAARNGDYYYSTIANGTRKDGDMFRLLDVLGTQVGVKGIFSDWSATVSFYANCMGFS
ncbi:glycerophosphoryl diester phosphodiesterase family protein [Xylariaceae sp. FL0594]|nr:glycerophosphoryl diester phosphodiesterase family protein [Xylariaceae sp. FL0594]